VRYLTVDGRCLEYQWHKGKSVDAPTVVFLHEGLGSIGLWKNFPQQLVDASGCSAVVYSRYGNGFSDVLTEARQPDYMHREARAVLPEFLDKLNVSNPILFGHSDGASIALIHAAMESSRILSIVALAPHVIVEDLTLENIRAARTAYQSTDLPSRLSKYHKDADSTFWGWNDIWLSPDFRDWNIESLLSGIRCPVLAIQGREDEYGTLRQLDILKREMPTAQLRVLDQCRHSPHRDQPAALLSAVGDFIRRYACS
jgi:pimeloyl-ACP methyl ester carboxylesterase